MCAKVFASFLMKFLQNEEWERFQNDLLTSVRVANDFKTEAQQNVQKLILENKAERERIKLLEAQIDKLKGKFLCFLWLWGY